MRGRRGGAGEVGRGGAGGHVKLGVTFELKEGRHSSGNRTVSQFNDLAVSLTLPLSKHEAEGTKGRGPAQTGIPRRQLEGVAALRSPAYPVAVF